MREWIDRFARTLFGFSEPVDARTYAIAGIGLSALKYAVDASVIGIFTHRFWSPIAYLSPSLLQRQQIVSLPTGLELALALWTLPFLWIGVSMTIRRAVDAGWSPWAGLLFFAPFLNYLVMLVLCLRPSVGRAPWAVSAAPVVPGEQLRSALLGVVASLAIALPLVVLQTTVLRGYGVSLFFGTPFVLGVLSAYLYNRDHPHALFETQAVVVVAHVMLGGGLLLFAVEGLVCIAMAAPIALAVGLAGGWVGREIALRSPREPAHAMLTVLAIPLLGLSGPARKALPLHEVVSQVEIAAPPAMVWRHVVSFAELPPPRELLFQLGIAYPMRAIISGEGVGAIRRCEFSTGAFVEPITVWDAPRRLAFDVTASPIPMEEWSPYRTVYAAHLDGYFRSRSGEFRLIALPGGRTRLEGRTWYTLDIHPSIYWSLYADGIVHAIHQRVLAHVKHLAEEDAARVASGVDATPSSGPEAAWPGQHQGRPPAGADLTPSSPLP